MVGNIYICYHEWAFEYECIEGVVLNTCPPPNAVYYYPSRNPIYLEKNNYIKIGECDTAITLIGPHSFVRNVKPYIIMRKDEALSYYRY
ncbi:hypothetical protein CLV24_11726 [Pontibacter ummariensis]|uniref:Uncharacterized protein n=1 Tax=Pontibacter ummariensis TaxID=1610492 RepID=A0A239IGX2_9BACT|nr:hypothetical protein CLV24_11726 [Pontibacter ummariensis]SNS92253.1 hypothetical protein SAMN06296052_11726 [Pontibacter ummariensis]